MKIVYTKNDHGHTILSWGEVYDIDWVDREFYDIKQYRIHVFKYAERGGYIPWSGTSSVILRNPTVLIVGKSIEDIPS
jgi:hypothetical protein